MKLKVRDGTVQIVGPESTRPPSTRNALSVGWVGINQKVTWIRLVQVFAKLTNRVGFWKPTTTMASVKSTLQQ